MGEVLQSYSRENHPHGVVSGREIRGESHSRCVRLPETPQVHHRGQYGVRQALNPSPAVERVLEQICPSEYFVERKHT